MQKLDYLAVPDARQIVERKKPPRWEFCP